MEQKELEEKVRQRKLMIFTEGKTKNGIMTDMKIVPDWFNRNEFEHAQKLFKTYGAIIRISQFYGLLLVLHDPYGAIPLLCTGNSRTISKLFRRYLSTIIRVNNWFEDDPFDSNSKCHKQLNIVRKMHQTVAKKMNGKSCIIENSAENIWIPQYGMCIAQFTFLGFMALFPKQLGFHNFTKKDFHSIFHFWRVIGYCLGTDDKYNLCDGTDEEIIEFCRQIYFDQWLPAIKSSPYKKGMEMSKGIGIAMSEINPLLDTKILLHYAAPFLQLNRDDYQLNFVERINYNILNLFYNLTTRFTMGNAAATLMSNYKINSAIRNCEQIEKRLEQKYPNTIYEFENNNDDDNNNKFVCPFTKVEFEYADAF